ncbi:hypothetical protein HZS_1174 [Henneguya salminicola]|nr:hypothetical protein HZS_1174 [Henneguya salminicola]
MLPSNCPSKIFIIIYRPCDEFYNYCSRRLCLNATKNKGSIRYSILSSWNCKHCFASFENYLIQKGRMDQIMEIFKYFKDNFIRRLHRNIRQQPLFAVNIWHLFTRIMGNVPRTNNIVEGWHRGFSTLASASHLNIEKFVEIFKKEQSLTNVKMDNTPIRPQNEKYQLFKPTDQN